MLRAVAFGLAAGAGVQAWRQWPADGPVTTSAGVVVMVAGVLCAYLAGRWHGRGGATATAVAVAQATATATAQQSVQVAVVLPGAGAGRGMRVPDESVEWFGSPRGEIDSDRLEGLDLSEFAQDVEQEHETA